MQDTSDNVYLSAPQAILDGSVEIKTRFDLVFSDDVPAEAQAAMRFAADIWGSYLDSDVPVRVAIDWQDRDDNRLLASAGPATLFRDFTGSTPNTWYPVALAEAIAGRDLNATGDADINVNANSTANWYFGTDGNTPRRNIDLVTVMLHELGHGLGFLSSVDTINENQLAIGFGDRFIVYDLFLEASGGVPLADQGVFSSPSEALLMAVTSNDLTFDGLRANEENESEEVPIFSPANFDRGSSVSHLNESSYRAGTENALMTPFLSAGEAVHDPGPVTLGIFEDMGWPLDFNLTSNSTLRREKLALFPNPASERINFVLDPDSDALTARFYSADGRFAKEAPLNGRAVSTAGLTPGIYVVIVPEQDRVLQAKVIIR